MNVKFFDKGDESNPLNGSTIHDSRRLLQILQGMRGRKPFFCELVGENGFELGVGIAPTVGCAQYSRSDGEPPYLVTVDKNAKPEESYKEFLYQNTATEVPTRECLPLQSILEVAVFFQETGRPSPAVSWEEI